MKEGNSFLEAISCMSHKELGDILKNVIDYAENKLDAFGFVPRSETDSVTGEDFAQEAFRRVIEGKRKWDSNTQPDIKEFLRMVVFSLIRNHQKKTQKSPVFIEDIEDEGYQYSAQHLQAIVPSPHEISVTVEEWNRLENAFGDDLEGYIIFTDWLDNISPAEIAKKYNAKINLVYQKIRKSKGIVKKVFSK